jgi:hypothetical protein
MFRALRKRTKLSEKIDASRMKLDLLKRQRAELEESLERDKRELDALEGEFLPMAGVEFDQMLGCLKSLVGVTDIDFRDDGMVIGISICFVQEGALYDLGDWSIYLGGGNVASCGYACYCIKNERSGVRPDWDRSLPPGNREDLIGSVAHGSAACDYVNEGRYLEAAALIIADMYRFDEEQLMAIPRAYQQIGSAAV